MGLSSLYYKVVLTSEPFKNICWLVLKLKSSSEKHIKLIFWKYPWIHSLFCNLVKHKVNAWEKNNALFYCTHKVTKKFKAESIKQIKIHLGNYLMTFWTNSKMLKNYYFN